MSEIIALDTNIITALQTPNHIHHHVVLNSLTQSIAQNDKWVVCATVHAELFAYYQEDKLLEFYRSTGITIDYHMSRAAWNLVAKVHRSHMQNRKKSGNTIAKRPIADAFIGAHAACHAYALYTLNPKDYRGFGTQLTIIT